MLHVGLVRELEQPDAPVRLRLFAQLEAIRVHEDELRPLSRGQEGVGVVSVLRGVDHNLDVGELLELKRDLRCRTPREDEKVVVLGRSKQTDECLRLTADADNKTGCDHDVYFAQGWMVVVLGW